MRAILLAAAAAIWAGNAGAAVYRFDYANTIFNCTPEEDAQGVCDDYYAEFGVSYDVEFFIIIDEGLLPSKNLASSRLDLADVNPRDDSPDPRLRHFTATTPQGTISVVTQGEWETLGLQLAPLFDAWLTGFTIDGYLEFDASENLVGWRAHHLTGGSWDLNIYSDPGYGCDPCNYASDGNRGTARERGSWTRTILVPDASPVPLPASAPLLFAGIGGLAYMRRRSQGR